MAQHSGVKTSWEFNHDDVRPKPDRSCRRHRKQCREAFQDDVCALYQALDLSDGSQIAVFGDGVCTSAFKPLQVLGLALGVGVKRNVLNLYKFLCLNYNDTDKDSGLRI